MTVMGTRRLDALTTLEVEDLPKERALVVQPIGAIEQHGPHLPCSTDALIADTLANLGADRAPAGTDVWVLPPLSYGKSNEHLGRAGTISMSAHTLISVCMDVGRSVRASGFRKLAFVNGHGGQPGLLDLVSRDIRVETGLQVFPVNIGRLGLPAGVVEDDPFGIHGGQLETAVVMAIAPELVHEDRFAADGLAAGEQFRSRRHLTLEGPVPTAWVTDDLSLSGVIGDPTGATRELGETLVGFWADALAGAYAEICGFEFAKLQ